HRQIQRRSQNLQWNRRRTAPRAEIEPALGRICHVARGRERLDQQSIDRPVVRTVDVERRQIHFQVPAGEELNVDLEAIEDVGSYRYARPRRTAFDQRPKRAHEKSLSESGLPGYRVTGLPGSCSWFCRGLGVGLRDRNPGPILSSKNPEPELRTRTQNRNPEPEPGNPAPGSPNSSSNPASIRRQSRDSRRRDAGDALRMPERIGLDLRQTLHHLARQTRDPIEGESARDPAALVPPRAFHLTLLTPEIT